MHHGRMGAGADARHSFKQRHPELSFPVRSMSPLSRPDLAKWLFARNNRIEGAASANL